MKEFRQEKSLIKQNILRYLSEMGISQYEFYKLSGVTRGILQQNNGISEDNISRFLAYAPDVSSDWLLTGRGEMMKTKEKVISPKLVKTYPANNINYIAPTAPTGNPDEIHPATSPAEGIPLIPINAMAGVLTGEVSILEYECERYVVPMFKGADFLISVKGSSMYPKYSSGDIVACQRVPMSDLFFQWNKVYIIDTDQGALIKRIKPGSDKEHVLIVSDNEKYDPFELPYSAIHAVALVIGVIRLE